jgi:hypothetical protein
MERQVNVIMNFVFENYSYNFVSCKDINTSTLPRFAPSPFAETVINFGGSGQRFSLPTAPTKYIIATGVNHHPVDWTSSQYTNNGRKGCFFYLNKKYISDLQNGNAMLLFDQSFEGYQTTWLWDYFHRECAEYNINPRAIIYVTGNLIADEQYNKWALSNHVTERINVIPYSHFEKDVFMMANSVSSPTSIAKSLCYKQKNKADISTYNCLQKRLRSHRIWLYTELFKAELLKDGLVSMNPCNNCNTQMEGRIVDDGVLNAANKLLPLNLYSVSNNLEPDNFYIRRILNQVYLDTWVSIISEASFADDENTVFISEKTFKSIASFHPFIIFGNKGSLQKLREMGYKTFDGFIDETYDTLSTFDRMQAVIHAIGKINAIEDKFAWFLSMRDILKHNYNVLKINSEKNNEAIEKLNICYSNYLKKDLK